MLAERRRGEAVVANRTGGDAERPAGIAVPAGDGMLEILVISARIELRHVIHPLRRDHLRDRDIAIPKSRNDIGG